MFLYYFYSNKLFAVDIDIFDYHSSTGSEPFTDWVNAWRDILLFVRAGAIGHSELWAWDRSLVFDCVWSSLESSSQGNNLSECFLDHQTLTKLKSSTIIPQLKYPASKFGSAFKKILHEKWSQTDSVHVPYVWLL